MRSKPADCLKSASQARESFQMGPEREGSNSERADLKSSMQASRPSRVALSQRGGGGPEEPDLRGWSERSEGDGRKGASRLPEPRLLYPRPPRAPPQVGVERPPMGKEGGGGGEGRGAPGGGGARVRGEGGEGRTTPS